MNRTFAIPSRLHPAYSLLGRWIRRRVGDPRAAESTFIVVATLLALAIVLAQYLSWAYLSPMSPSALKAFLAAELTVAAAYAAFAVLGRQPEIRVEVDDLGLRIHRKNETLSVPFTEISGVGLISGRTYYGHYARYASTCAFVNRIHPNLLLLEWLGRPVVLGLQPADVLELERILSERIGTSQASSRVGAA